MADSPSHSSGHAPGRSLSHAGGEIPGAPGARAYSLQAPEPSAIPVLIAVPHAGRVYPPCLVERLRNPGFAALRLEDRYVDRLAQGVALATGAALLLAHAPRAMIDLNRAVDDVDWEMIAPPDASSALDARMLRELERSRGSRGRAGIRRADSGLGLIPRRLPGIGELWKRRHSRADLEGRIMGIHDPYHACLGQALDRLRQRWGAVLLIDLHSMPPLPRSDARLAPEFVLGDRFGGSCAGMLTASAFGYFARERRTAAHNRPYAGGYVLERHARPASGIHAMQVEIDRTSYLDPRMAELGPGFAGLVQLLTGLVRRLAGEVADLGRPLRYNGSGWNGPAEAAE